MKKAKQKWEKHAHLGGMGLLPSMLIIIMSALLICVTMASVLFSMVGTTVYARIKAEEMIPQANFVAEMAQGYLTGVSVGETLGATLRAGDSTIVILFPDGSEAAYGEPMHNQFEIPQRGEDPLMPQGQNPDGSDRQEPPGMPDFGNTVIESEIKQSNIAYCKAIIDKVVDSEGAYTKYSSRVGAVVGVRVEDTYGNTVGAVFLIKPVDEIIDASRSVTFALLISVIIVAVLMIMPTFIITRWFTAPVERMSEAALKLADGSFNEKVRIEGAYELRELGSSFNVLVDKLRENIGSLVVERNRLRAVLDGLEEGIIAVDTDCEITHFNSSAAMLLGGKQGERPETLPEYADVKTVINDALNGNGNHTAEFKCGSRKIHVNATAIYEENGAVAGAVALLMDVTEADRLEQTRRDYVANVSHELRTPLASIRSIADMLNDGLVKTEADKQRYYGYILRESIRLSTLINDLLELSRLQSGGVALSLSRFDMYEMIMDVADRMGETAAERDMSISVLISEGVYNVISNPDRIEEVLVSLVDNAVKHGDEGTTITVGMYGEGAKWKVYVQNQAVIDETALEHLFERFYKADVAHTGDGTGLGLAITEEVLHLLGEEIRVDYENGQIRFTFTIEREQTQLTQYVG